MAAHPSETQTAWPSTVDTRFDADRGASVANTAYSEEPKDFDNAETKEAGGHPPPFEQVSSSDTSVAKLEEHSTSENDGFDPESQTNMRDGKLGQEIDEKEPAPADPFLVTWDGPNDPANPKNWSTKRKWLCTCLVSLITFMTPIASSMIAPAADAIDRDLHVTSQIVSSLIFSIFLLGFVIGPLLLAPLSEVYGRVIVLQLANIFFLIWTLACGFVQNEGEMLAFRLISGLGACAPQTVGGGVIGDLFDANQRGTAIAMYSLAPLLGPSLGPIIGAWVTERTTWRWCFWAVTMFGACVQVLIFFTLSETFAPTLLQRKAVRIRKETGNEQYHAALESEDRSLWTVFKSTANRVTILLVSQPIMQFLALYMSMVYGIIYLLLSIFPNVWTGIYGESIGIGGLNYISLMIGLTLGAQVGGRSIDAIYHRLKARAPDGKGTAEMRVPILYLSTFCLGGGLFLFGWTAQYHVQWVVPNIGAAIFGFGSAITFAALQVYTIDTYPHWAASAIGCTAMARSLTGFGFPLFAPYMFDALGYGWGSSVLGFVVWAVGFGGASLLWFYGGRLRASSKLAKSE